MTENLGVKIYMTSTADFKNGLILIIDENLWQIVAFQHVKPGKGSAFVRTKLKNVISGKIFEKTYNAGTKVITTTVDRRETIFLYRENKEFIFMDSINFEQYSLSKELVGHAADFLLEGMSIQIAFYKSTPLYLDLPTSVELTVVYTEPGIQGDRANAGTKLAVIETGAKIQVPLFIQTKDRLKIDTRNSSYLGRVNG